MRTLFPIVVNLVFGLCLIGVIFLPLEFNLPTRMLMTFYIVSIIMLVLTFGITYTIIDIRNVLLNIDKKIRNMELSEQNLSENPTEVKSKELSKAQNNMQDANKYPKTNDTENRLICPYCGADYSEYPYAKACFNCHKFFDTEKK